LGSGLLLCAVITALRRLRCTAYSLRVPNRRFLIGPRSRRRLSTIIKAVYSIILVGKRPQNLVRVPFDRITRAVAVATDGKEPDLIIAALLHDAIEDQEVSRVQLLKRSAKAWRELSRR
jgi:hypothetical protein